MTAPHAVTSRAPWRPGPPLLGLLAGWVALVAWSGMVAKPSGFLVPTLVVGIVIALVGSGLRVLRAPVYAVVLVQTLIALGSLNAIFASRQSLLGLVPTQDSVRRVVYIVTNGGATLNAYASPVEVNPTHTAAILTACGLGVLLSIDVLAMSLLRPPLIALPLLITLSVPVSILNDALALPVFVGVALLFLRLLASEHLDRFRGWGQRASGAGGWFSGAPDDDQEDSTRPVLATWWQVSLLAVVAALLLAPLVPVTDLLNRDGGDGTGTGQGGRFELTTTNPLLRLRRDLVQQTHTPLVYAETKARSTAYLRLTVLDDFTSDAWRPSPRLLPRENDADGVFPNPPGLAPGLGGVEDRWSLQLAPGFTTTWLPLPYPIRELDVPGTWRYDERTLDVAYIRGDGTSLLRYGAKAFTPAITATMLDSTIPAPGEVLRPMTEVPRDLPEVITQRAREVTRGATNNFDKAVALQDWFRGGGGFRYSLEQRSGSGMDLLASFVTDDRVGYCEQFAAAMAAMGRALGIPSRVVVGFLDGTEEPDGRILYTSDDRHAWPEMYFTGVGWVRFEPTPGQRAGATPDYTRQSGEAAQPSAAPSAGADQEPAQRPDQAPTDVGSKGAGGSSVPWWSVVVLLLVLVLALGPGLVRADQRRRRLGGSDPVHLAEGAWAELRATALDLGLDWPEQRTPREQARSMVGQVRAEEEDLRSLEGLLLRVELGRYGPGGAQGVQTDVRDRTTQAVGSWRRVMVRSVDRSRGWRGRVWPASLLRRRG